MRESGCKCVRLPRDAGLKSRLIWAGSTPVYILPGYSMGPVDDEGVISILALHIASYALRIGVSVMEL